jgi:periplasmic protein TonB
MFDLTAQPAKRPLGEPSLGSRLAAVFAHAAGLAALIAVPVSHIVNVQTERPTIEAFVAMPETLPPLPAPPPPPAAASVPPVKTERLPVAEPSAAPTEAPADVQPEHTNPSQVDAGTGLEGGVEGGVLGGVVGGLGTVAPIPPPPPRPPTRSVAPIRVSGAIKAPDLLRRVEPVYSAIAAASHISGVVVLEAVIDVNGSIESVKVLRGRSPFLDNAAAEALKQWKYAPLVVAGIPTPFAVTVTFNFRIPTA